MSRSTRYHLDEIPDGANRHLSKEQFGRKLYHLMLEKGWNQSELARRADLTRDSISTYIRGKSLPTALSLSKLAKALGMESTELLPNAAEGAIAADVPSIDFKVSEADPTVAWLRINRRVKVQTATKILSLLASDGEGGDETLDAG